MSDFPHLVYVHIFIYSYIHSAHREPLNLLVKMYLYNILNCPFIFQSITWISVINEKQETTFHSQTKWWSELLFQVSIKIMFVVSEVYGMTIAFGLNNNTEFPDLFPLYHQVWLCCLQILKFWNILKWHLYITGPTIILLLCCSPVAVIHVDFLWHDDTIGHNGTCQENY